MISTKALHHINNIFLSQPEIFGEDSAKIKVFRNILTEEMVQLHEKTGLFRTRPAPTEAEKFPEYGEWQQ